MNALHIITPFWIPQTKSHTHKYTLVLKSHVPFITKTIQCGRRYDASESDLEPNPQNYLLAHRNVRILGHENLSFLMKL